MSWDYWQPFCMDNAQGSANAPPDNGTGMGSVQGGLAAGLLFWAAGLSSTEALLAVAGWIFI